MKNIAAQLYNVKKYCQNLADLDETLGKLKAMGYDEVQFADVPNLGDQVTLDLVNKHGIEICCTHVGFDQIKANLDAEIAKHKLWNVEYMGIPEMPRQYWDTYNSVKEFIKQLKPIAEKVEASGLTLCYHNHGFEFTNLNGTFIMDMLCEAFPESQLQFILDTYWVQFAGKNNIDVINRYSSRIPIVHLKDMKIVDHKQEFAAVGEGNIEFKPILDLCKNIGVKWYVVEQDRSDRDPFDCLKSSYNYLNNVM